LFAEIERRLSQHVELGDAADVLGDKLINLLQGEIARRKRVGITPEKFRSSGSDPQVQ
jgi:hypothetical protein